jgi:hypothetical protein
MLPLLPIVAAVASAGPACQGLTTSADLVAGLQTARDAYSDLDLDAFRDAIYDVRLVVPCLSEALTPHDAAEVHRFEGLLGFVERDPDRSARAFAAARAIEPMYRFPESLVPAGNGALVDYSAIDPDSGARDRVPAPLDGRILFDGEPEALRPSDFPTLVQLVDGRGVVTATVYLWPGEALPPYAPRPIVSESVDDDHRSASSAVGALQTGPNRSLLTGAAFTGVAAAGLYAGAFVVSRRYDSQQTELDQLGALRTVNNSLVVASGAAASVALGLGTSAFLVGRF